MDEGLESEDEEVIYLGGAAAPPFVIGTVPAFVVEYGLRSVPK